VSNPKNKKNKKNKKLSHSLKTKKTNTEKKNQVLKKKKANDRKSSAKEKLLEIGLELSDNIYSIGILFDNLNISHLTYVGLNNINNICDQYIGLDIYIFTEQIARPCIDPKCAVGLMKDVFGWQEPLVATSINTCIYALNSSSKNIYYYAFDVDFINNYNVSWRTIKKVFCDPRVTVVVRHKDHKALIESEFDIKTSNVIIEDFNLVTMAKLIIEDKKNDERVSDKIEERRTKEHSSI